MTTVSRYRCHPARVAATIIGLRNFSAVIKSGTSSFLALRQSTPVSRAGHL